MAESETFERGVKIYLQNHDGGDTSYNTIRIEMVKTKQVLERKKKLAEKVAALAQKEVGKKTLENYLCIHTF